MAQYEKKKKHVAEYELGITLGEGAFGKVKLGTNVFTGQKVAVKIISGDKARSHKDKLQLERERSILLRMNHPNIVNLIKVVDDETNNKCYLILEYVNGGELFDYIISYGRLSEKEARKFMRQIISAVEYCHSLLIVHRDLKPENLLLDEKLNIKISDFGLSNVMTPGKKFSTFCGSLHYACPEILKGKEYLGPGVDIWAMGIILYCLVVGRQPWDGSDASSIINSILEDGLEIPDGISDGCVNLILSMLRVNEADRISLSKMRFHPWINEGFDEPPRCYLAVPQPVSDIDDTIIDQLKLMHFIKEENVLAIKQAITNGQKENQAVCIYHLLAQQKQDKLKAEDKTSSKTFVKKNPNDTTRDRRSASVTQLGATKNSRESSSNSSSKKSSSSSKEKSDYISSTGRSSTVSSTTSPMSPKIPSSKPMNILSSSSPPKSTTRDNSLESLDNENDDYTRSKSPNSPSKTQQVSSPKKKRIIVSKAESFRHTASSSASSTSSTKLRSNSLRTSSGESGEFSKERKDKEKEREREREREKEKIDSDEKEPKELELESEEKDNPANKSVRKYSRPERPLMNLDAISRRKSPSKEKDLLPSPKSRVSRTGSGSFFSNKASVLNNNLFAEPKQDEQDKKLSDEKNVPSIFHTKLVSNLSTEQLCAEIESILKNHSISYSKKGVLFKCKSYDGVTECQFSIEVIKKDENLRGIKIKRSGGSGFAYQNVYSTILVDLKSSLALG